MQKLDQRDDAHALADPQGRPRGLPRSRTAGSRSPSRSGSTRSPRTRRPRRCRSTSTSSCSPASCAARPSSSCRAKTIDLDVPANAEIVLEGYVEQGDLAHRGAVRRPHRLLHRRRAVPGLPRDRDDDAARRDLPVDRRRQAAAGGRVARQGDRADLPAGGADDACRRSSTTTCPVAGAFHNCCIVSIRKAFPGHAQKVMHAIWGLGMLSLTKAVVVVDEHVDVHDYEEVLLLRRRERRPEARRAAHRRAARPPRPRADAAVLRRQDRDRRDAKGPDEGTREWPPEIEMSPEVRELVDRRWDEYGIALDPAAGNGRMRQSSARCAICYVVDRAAAD